MTSEYVQRLAEWWGSRVVGDLLEMEFDSPEQAAQEALDASGATARIEELEKETPRPRYWRERAKKAERVEKQVEEWKEIAKDNRYSNEFLGNVVRAALSQAQQSEPS